MRVAVETSTKQCGVPRDELLLQYYKHMQPRHTATGRCLGSESAPARWLNLMAPPQTAAPTCIGPALGTTGVAWLHAEKPLAQRDAVPVASAAVAPPPAVFPSPQLQLHASHHSHACRHGGRLLVVVVVVAVEVTCPASLVEL